MTKNIAQRSIVFCVKNDGYLASLEPRKIYPALPDAKAAKHGLVRVIDESGEDYLYPAEFFMNTKRKNRCTFNSPTKPPRL